MARILRRLTTDREVQLSIINHGLKVGVPLDKGLKRVVVVGAGVSGLCAALELKRAGFDVEVLERTHRVGGRVYTIREPFSDGLWGEAGAMRFPAHHFLVWAYAEKLRLETNAFQNSFDAKPGPVYYFDNTRTFYHPDTYGDLHKHWTSLGARTLPIHVKFRDTMRKLKGEIDQFGYKAVVAKYDPMSIEQFLRAFGWNDTEIMLHGVTSTEESYLGASAVNNFQDFECNDDVTGSHEFKGGMDSFPLALLRELGSEKVRFGAKVDCISDGVVEYDTSGVRGSSRFDFLVLAVPSLVMRSIKVTPPLSAAKQAAIRQAEYSPSGKIFLQYKKRWWRDPNFTVDGVRVDAPENGAGGAFTTLGIRQLYYPPEAHSCNTDRGVIIASYTWEQDTLHWGSRSSEKDMVRDAVQDVDTIFPGTRDLFEVGTAVMWHNVEWTGGGAFAFFRPGQWTTVYKNLFTPDRDRGIVFAGEQCSPTHAWMQGALDAALCACQDLVNLRCDKLRAVDHRPYDPPTDRESPARKLARTT